MAWKEEICLKLAGDTLMDIGTFRVKTQFQGKVWKIFNARHGKWFLESVTGEIQGPIDTLKEALSLWKDKEKNNT